MRELAPRSNRSTVVHDDPVSELTASENGSIPIAADSTPTCSESDRATVRAFIRELKTACDDLYADPFCTEARNAVLRLIQGKSPTADLAMERIVGADHRNRVCDSRG